MEALIKDGIARGYPESVTLQGREDQLGMLPIHLACEHGRLAVVEVSETLHTCPYLALLLSCSLAIENVSSRRSGDSLLAWNRSTSLLIMQRGVHFMVMPSESKVQIDSPWDTHKYECTKTRRRHMSHVLRDHFPLRSSAAY